MSTKATKQTNKQSKKLIQEGSSGLGGAISGLGRVISLVDPTAYVDPRGKGLTGRTCDVAGGVVSGVTSGVGAALHSRPARELNKRADWGYSDHF